MGLFRRTDPLQRAERSLHRVLAGHVNYYTQHMVECELEDYFEAVFVASIHAAGEALEQFAAFGRDRGNGSIREHLGDDFYEDFVAAIDEDAGGAGTALRVAIWAYLVRATALAESSPYEGTMLTMRRLFPRLHKAEDSIAIYRPAPDFEDADSSYEFMSRTVEAMFRGVAVQPSTESVSFSLAVAKWIDAFDLGLDRNASVLREMLPHDERLR